MVLCYCSILLGIVSSSFFLDLRMTAPPGWRRLMATQTLRTDQWKSRKNGWGKEAAIESLTNKLDKIRAIKGTYETAMFFVSLNQTTPFSLQNRSSCFAWTGPRNLAKPREEAYGFFLSQITTDVIWGTSQSCRVPAHHNWNIWRFFVDPLTCPGSSSWWSLTSPPQWRRRGSACITSDGWGNVRSLQCCRGPFTPQQLSLWSLGVSPSGMVAARPWTAKLSTQWSTVLNALPILVEIYTRARWRTFTILTINSSKWLPFGKQLHSCMAKTERLRNSFFN